MSSLRRALAAVAGTAIAVAGLQTFAVTTASANTAGTGLVINEVYGGGGASSGSPFSNADWVELYNPTASAIPLTGMSLQYRSATGTGPATAAGLGTGTVPANGYYLVQVSAGSFGPALSPAPDFTTTTALNMAATNGQVILSSSTTAIAATGTSMQSQAGVVDFVGYGTSPTSSETAPTGAVLDSTKSVQRKTPGLDTDNNSLDFAAPAAPTPQNSGTGGGSTSLSVNSVSAKSWTVGTAITDITPGASGGTSPYSFTVTGLPAGVTYDGTKITGTPTATGSGTATIHATDSAAPTAGTATGTFTWTVGSASAASHVLVSEVWGDGGFTGAPYKNSYIELYNPTGAAISLSGDSIAYVAASNATPPVVGATQQSNLTGSIPAHGYYLIAGTSNAANAGVALPTPDATSTIAWHYADGTIALLDTQAAVSLPGGDLTGASHVIDAVGYGPTTGFAPVAYEGAVTGTATGLSAAAYRDPSDSDTNNNAADFKTGALSPTNAAGVTGTAGGGGTATCNTALPAATKISDVQGSTGTSPYVACTESVTGVITGLYTASYASNGNLSCGMCGFYMQDPAGDPNDGKSDAIFVYAGSAFQAKDSAGTSLKVGDSVTASGKISEFNSVTTQTETLTELNATTDTTSHNTTTVTDAGTAPTPVVPQTTLPTTYADREAHEGEAFAPTDTVVTETYNYESDGEFGLATGNKPLVEPTEVCGDNNAGNAVANYPVTGDDAACLAAADTDVVNRGYFLGTGTTTAYTTSATHYDPSKSKNSDIPLPYADKDHSVRVGAHVTAASGHALILDFRHDVSASSGSSGSAKWYLQPQRSISANGCSATAPHTGCTVDLGTDVVSVEDTRADNLAPANVTHGDADALKIATYNVENFFDETGQAFAAANPHYACSYDNDRQGNPILTYQCTSPDALPSAWDAVSGAATAYKSGLVNGPRGAARAADQQRQTDKIVTAINGLNADIVSLEELENPNKIKEGVKTDPLHPLAPAADTSPLKDQGLGTAIAWRDQTISYLVDKLNAALVAQGGTAKWGFVASPAEATDNTSIIHMCSIQNADGSPIAGNEASRANASCSYASGQDVIRPGFIYDKTKVVPVGPSDIDFAGYTANGLPDAYGNHSFGSGVSPFDNAREPLAQYFKRVGDPNANGFAVVVNHFKSKGNDTDTAGVSAAKTVNGQPNENYNDPRVGSNNGNRTKQALEVLRFANAFAAKWHTDKVFMVGDFNAYTGEDPVQAILKDPSNQVGNGGLGFQLQESDDPNDLTYDYSTTETVPSGYDVSYGAVGSIDHVFVSSALKTTVTGTDVWEINANEPDAYDYGRYNTNATNFFDSAVPFRGSDHNPEIIGFHLPAAATSDKVTDVAIMGANDFHGRLVGDSSDGGAAQLAGAAASVRNEYGADKTVLAGVGDMIGASAFESNAENDKPSLDALNAMGMDVSAAGDHEFDKGWQDLLGRVEKPYDATSNKYGPDGGLDFPYLAANVKFTQDETIAGHTYHAGDVLGATNASDLASGANGATMIKSIPNPLDPSHPIKIGFVGTVTEDLPSLVSQTGLQGITTGSIVDATNQYADALKAAGANLVVLLVHEGAPSTDCSTMTSGDGPFAHILNHIDDNVDAVLSGHTHLAYSCSLPVAGWQSNANHPIKNRPVLQAASYALDFDKLVYSFNAAGTPVHVDSDVLAVKGTAGTLFNYPQDPTVKTIVDQAIAASAAVGDEVLGKIAGPFKRSKLSDGTTENRGGESTLGNQIAEIQRWATSTPEHGGAQIAFMNPGGLRADLLGNPDGSAFDVTYRQADDVQPFANELTNMQLTGAQIKTVLEQQWQRNLDGSIPARPFLKLGISEGFSYTYHEVADASHAGATKGVIDGMWLNGTPIDPAQTYSVTVNSFLAEGGDQFWELDNGADKKETAETDLQAQVEYMKQYQTTPLPVDFSQRGVEVTFPSPAPASYQPGDHVTFGLASLDMTAPGDMQDSTLTVKLGATVLASGVAVTHGDNSMQPYDDRGKAQVDVVLPPGACGDRLTLQGDVTGTVVTVPVSMPACAQPLAIGTLAAHTWTVGTAITPVTVTATGGTAPYTFSATGLPAGVNISPAGVISGTPTAAGSGSATVSASDSAMPTAATTGTSLSWTVSAAPVTLSIGSLPAQSWTVGTAIATVTASASGGTSPYTYSATNLPAGVSINASTGAITGTPTAAGSGSATVSVSDSASHSVGTSLSWTVNAAGSGPGSKVAAHISVKVTPKKIVAKRTKAKITVTVTAPGVTPTGSVTVTVDGKTRTIALVNGKATVKKVVFRKPGKKRHVIVKYAGDSAVTAATFTANVKVVKH